MNKFTGVCSGKEGIVKAEFRNVTWRYDSAGQLFVDYQIRYKQDFPPELSVIFINKHFRKVFIFILI